MNSDSLGRRHAQPTVSQLAAAVPAPCSTCLSPHQPLQAVPGPLSQDSPWAGHRAPRVGNGQPGGLVSFHFSRSSVQHRGLRGCAPAQPLRGSCSAGTVEAEHWGAGELQESKHGAPVQGQGPQERMPTASERRAGGETSPAESWLAQQPVIPP